MFNKIFSKIFFLFSLFISESIFSQTIQDLERRMKVEQNVDENDSEIKIDEGNIENINPKMADIQPYKLNVDKSKEENIFFGYDFFTKRDTVSFWENLPAPSNYIIGPGDELIISIWGETQLRKAFVISKDGTIYDEKVGLMNVMGKTIEQCKEYLSAQYGQIYSSLKGRKPAAFLDISIGQIRSINVSFVGEVNFPGLHTIHPFSNVITGLIQAGGVDTTGTLRNIIIKRNEKTQIEIDLYQYLLKGSITKNIQLRDQDIVVVPFRKNRIKIDSNVVRPGIFEFYEGESIKEIIEYAGGLKFDVSSKIPIRRVVPLNKRTVFNDQHIKNEYIDFNDSHKLLAQDGDILSPQKILSDNNGVELVGQVKREGVFNFYEGMTLKNLIDLGGGFNDTTFLKTAKTKAELIRRDPNSRYEKVISVDLLDILKDGPSAAIKLSNLDRFVIHANPNYFERKNITISGEVNIPGEYPLVRDNEDLLTIVKRAGGFTNKALNDGIVIYRLNSSIGKAAPIELEGQNQPRMYRLAWKNNKISLMPGDSIIVLESTNTVEVSGEVYNPGLIEFQRNRSLRYYINSSGGLTNKADKKAINVVYPNGVVVPYKYKISPKITNGSKIIINKKIDEPEFDITQFATNWTSIISSLVTIFILSQQFDSQTPN